jgi:hypothetical protein
MYGSYKDNVLNTTLFIRNVSNVGYVCLDAFENVYIYMLYKFRLFGYDWANVGLGLLQNTVGNILVIKNQAEIISQLAETNDTKEIIVRVGKLFITLMDFDPVILETSSMDDDITLKNQKQHLV